MIESSASSSSHCAYYQEVLVTSQVILEPLIDYSCVLIRMRREQPTWSRWCIVIRSLPASSVDGMFAVPGDWSSGVCTVCTVCPVCSPRSHAEVWNAVIAITPYPIRISVPVRSQGRCPIMCVILIPFSYQSHVSACSHAVASSSMGRDHTIRINTPH